MKISRLAIGVLMLVLLDACGVSTPSPAAPPSPSPALAYPGPLATATTATALPTKSAPTSTATSPSPITWLGLELLWQPGDLPAGVQPDRLDAQIPDYFDLKLQVHPDAAANLPFGRDSAHRDYGHVEAYYFLKDASLKRAYEQLTQGEAYSNPGVPLPNIGEQATLFPGGDSSALYFRRCHTLVVIRFLSTTEQQPLLSYASRLDQRIKAVDCDGLASVPVLTPLPSMPAATPVPPISIARTITATVERLPDPSGTGVIRAFAFAGVDHGWLALGATILATTDGGQSWRPEYTTDSVVRRMLFSSAQSGWIETENGYLATRDGGSTWQRAAAQPDDGRPLMPALPTTPMNNGDPSYAFCTGQTSRAGRFTAIDALTAWAFCTSSPGDHYSFVRLYFTADGGKTWQLVSEQPPYGFWGNSDFTFLDRQHGWLIENDIGLFATADGGRTWRGVPVPGSDYFLYTLQFLSPEQGFATTHFFAGEPRDTLLRTDDGGASWRPVFQAPPPEPWPDGPLQFLAGDSGVGKPCATACNAVGAQTRAAQGEGGGVLTTRDAGRTWSRAGAITGACEGSFIVAISSLSFAGRERGWATITCASTPMAVLYQTTDGGATWSALARRLNGDDAYRDVSFVNERTGFLVTQAGYLFRTDDGGQTFAPVDGMAAHTPSLQFVTKDLGWETRATQLFETRDGGRTWRAVPIGYPVQQFALAADGRAWLVLGDTAYSGNPNPARRLVFTRDNAQTWTEYRIGPIPSDSRYPWLDRVQFVDALDGWLRADTALYYTADGGQRWVQLH